MQNFEDGGYMAVPLNQTFFPSGFQELFSIWNSLSSQNPSGEVALYAGGTGLYLNQKSRIPKIPQKIISLDRISELRKIRRTERYIEIGCMVKLSQIINLGKIVPEGLTRCLECIADPQLRSQATIGGNICNPSGKMDASGPMIALDAQYELRTAQSARWITASRFSSHPGPPSLAPQEMLTRIRIPLEPWNFTRYQKISIAGSNESGGGILFILRNQKDILTDIRIVYSGKAILKNKNSESTLTGKHLPLDRKDTMAFIEGWRAYLSELEFEEKAIFPGEGCTFRPDLIKAQILHFLESTFRHISY